MFLPDAPPLPNFKWLPIGYHGRASTVVVSGTPCRRPQGQTRPPGAAAPSFGPSRRLDYEMELGLFIGPGSPGGRAMALHEAEDQVFGMVLLNDWSARDIQGWESMPLGPFLAKNFLTSISPWIVTTEALAPYRCALPRTSEDPPPLSYLDPGAGPHASIDIELEVQLHTAASGDRAMRLSRSNYRHAYWAPAQLVAITAATVVACDPATSWAPARSRAPVPANKAACSNSRVAAGIRWFCPTASSAATSRTVTPSSCARGARGPVPPGSGSESVAGPCCQHSDRAAICAVVCVGHDCASYRSRVSYIASLGLRQSGR